MVDVLVVSRVIAFAVHDLFDSVEESRSVRAADALDTDRLPRRFSHGEPFSKRADCPVGANDRLHRFSVEVRPCIDEGRCGPRRIDQTGE